LERLRVQSRAVCSGTGPARLGWRDMAIILHQVWWRQSHVVRRFPAKLVQPIRQQYPLVLLVAGHKQERIRLAGIDCPESKQAFGTRAKQALTRRVAGKVVYGGHDVDLALVREGMCWWFRKYAHEQSDVDQAIYEEAEAKAREKRLGLWRDPAPVPPWEWRRERHGR
jgi:endonuclease YncB( thermonuclease family)